MAQTCFLALAIQPRSSEESSPSFMYTRRSDLKTTFAESTSGRCLRGRLGVLIITWPGSGLNRQLRIAGLSDTRIHATANESLSRTADASHRQTFHHGLLGVLENRTVIYTIHCSDILGRRIKHEVDLGDRTSPRFSADLRGIDLTNANLRGADLQNANLEGAVLVGTV